MYKILAVISFCLLLELFSSAACFSQVDARALSQADTSNFSIGKPSDWKLLNSFIALHEIDDSVSMDLVIMSDRSDIKWKGEQYIGSIKQVSLFPAEDRLIMYRLLDNLYSVRVAKNGKCYLSLEKGNPPPAAPYVIPLNVKYAL